MSIFNSPSARQVNAGILILRIVVGAIFIAHGWQKVFTFGFDGVAGGFAGMGVPFAGFMGPFVALVELLGGAALIAGLLTRLAAAGLAATMVGAVLLVHLPNGFMGPKGMEFPLSLMASSLTLMLTGAGAWSLDEILRKRRPSRTAKAAETGDTSGVTGQTT